MHIINLDQRTDAWKAWRYGNGFHRHLGRKPIQDAVASLG